MDSGTSRVVSRATSLQWTWRTLRVTPIGNRPLVLQHPDPHRPPHLTQPARSLIVESQASHIGGLTSRRGYGRSDPCELPRPLGYMHYEGLTVLPKLIENFRLKTYILIGHSDGGSIAIIYAGGTAAAGLQGLITEAPHVFCEDLSVESISAAKDAYENTDLRQKLEKYHHKNIDIAFWGWNGVWLDPEFMQWNIEEYLAAVTVPLLVMQGADDPYGTIAQVRAIEALSAGPADVALLQDCAHSPHRQAPEATLAAIIPFILGLKA